MENQLTIKDKIFGYTVLFFMRHIFRITRLEKLDMLPIGATLTQAKEMYGDPTEEKTEDDDPEATVYVFDQTFHEVLVTIKDSKSIGISFWTNPDDASPKRDLRAVLKVYGEGMEWRDMTPGYSKVRKDGRRRVNISAMPVIGVQLVDYPGYRDDIESNKSE